QPPAITLAAPPFPTRRSSDLGATTGAMALTNSTLSSAGTGADHLSSATAANAQLSSQASASGTESTGSQSHRTATVAPTTLDLRSEEHTSELQSRFDLVCRLL